MQTNAGVGMHAEGSGERRMDWDGIPVAASVPESWDGHTAVVLAHGAGQDMDSPFMSFFSQGVAAFGNLTLRFNFPYMAEGRRAPDSRKKLQGVYEDVIGRLVGEFAPRFLIAGGKSMGGRVASYVAADPTAIGALLFLGYPLHPSGQPDRLRDAHLYELSRPMLFVNGTRDTLANHSLLGSVVEKLGARATVCWVEGGDHSFRAGARSSERRDQALRAIGEWIPRVVEESR
jgi:predicted alpha/beta-hydrolase family hydrolase